MTPTKDTPVDPEVIRRQWTDAVADANEITDAIADGKLAGMDPDGDEMKSLEAQLVLVRAAADRAYSAYAKATANWATTAPRRFDCVITANTAVTESGLKVPALSFGFRGGDGPPLTVTLVNVEEDLRKFQANLDKAITTAVRACREANKK